MALLGKSKTLRILAAFRIPAAMAIDRCDINAVSGDMATPESHIITPEPNAKIEWRLTKGVTSTTLRVNIAVEYHWPVYLSAGKLKIKVFKLQTFNGRQLCQGI